MEKIHPHLKKPEDDQENGEEIKDAEMIDQCMDNSQELIDQVEK